MQIQNRRNRPLGRMESRIFGIETEFGCLVHDPLARQAGDGGRGGEGPRLLREEAWALIDLHARDYAFEPARAGGFLRQRRPALHRRRREPRGVRHRRSAAASVDVVAHDKAGQRILQGVAGRAGPRRTRSASTTTASTTSAATPSAATRITWSRLDDDFFSDAVAYLLPFLVTRQIFAGVGRVGGHRLNRTDFRNNIMTIGEHEVDYVWVHNFYGVEIDRHGRLPALASAPTTSSRPSPPGSASTAPSSTRSGTATTTTRTSTGCTCSSARRT